MKFMLWFAVLKRRDRPAVELSVELERLFFSKVLKQVEIDSLKNRCDHYQLEKFHRWKASLFPSYSQYFGFLAALKAKSAMAELNKYGYLDPLKSKPLKVIDIGAGTLGATLGVLDYLRDQNIAVNQLTALDAEIEPIQWASEFFRSWINIPISAHKSLSFDDGQHDLSNTLVIASDVLNEAKVPVESLETFKGHPLGRLLAKGFEKADSTSLFLFIEPASKDINQNLLRFRDALSDGAMNILLPCTHSMKCPALADDEWCHEDRDYKGPSVFWNLVHKLGFERRRLQFSLLAIGKQPSRFGSHHARVVSRQLKNKGRCDKWLCGQGQRWKASILTRHEGPENQAYFDADRGDILDSASTTIPGPVKLESHGKI